MHAGHEILKCICGKIIRECRCIDPFKSIVIQRPCKCEEPLTKPSMPPNLTIKEDGSIKEKE